MTRLNMCTYSTPRKVLEVVEDPWILFCDIVVIKRIHGSSKNTENSNNRNSSVNFEGLEDPWILFSDELVCKRIHGFSGQSDNENDF